MSARVSIVARIAREEWRALLRDRAAELARLAREDV